MSNQDQDPYSPDPYGQGPYRPGPAGERLVPPSTDQGGGGLRIGRLLVIGLAGGAVLYLLLSLFAGGDDHPQVADATSVPLIRANPEPAKVPPESPGGMEVPDQDKLIYDRIGGAGGSDSNLPEQLLPPPDEPMPRPTAPPPPPPVTEAPPPSAPTPEVGAPTSLTPPAAPAPVPETPPKPPAATAAPAPTTPPKPPAAATPAAPATPPATAAPATPPAPAAGGSVVIQLAALKDEATAKQAWARIAKANSDLLAGLKPIIVPVQVNGSTLYRLRAGPFATKDAAAQVCTKLKQRNQDCNVVR